MVPRRRLRLQERDTPLSPKLYEQTQLVRHLTTLYTSAARAYQRQDFRLYDQTQREIDHVCGAITALDVTEPRTMPRLGTNGRT